MHSEYRYSAEARTTAHPTGQSRRFPERRGTEENRGNINMALCCVAQIHVVITLQRQVLASAITTQLKEGATIM